MLVVCVNIILVAVVAVQKFIDRSNRVGMTRKFTRSWIDASCMSRNFYRCKLNHLLFLMVISVQDSKAARKTAQKRCVQTSGLPTGKSSGRTERCVGKVWVSSLLCPKPKA